jgi:hypothetical protein
MPPKRLVIIRRDQGAGVKGKMNRNVAATKRGKQIPLRKPKKREIPHSADSVRNDEL